MAAAFKRPAIEEIKMMCHMCGQTGDGESAAQKEYRLLTCRRCANVEAGRITRKPFEESGVGNKKPAAPNDRWLAANAGRKFARTVTVHDRVAAAATPEEGEFLLEEHLVKKRAALAARGRPGNLATREG